MNECVLIAGIENPGVADAAAYFAQRGTQRVAVLSTPEFTIPLPAACEINLLTASTLPDFLDRHKSDTIGAVIVFLHHKRNSLNTMLLETVAAVARDKDLRSICLVSTFRVHFNDKDAIAVEDEALTILNHRILRITTFRPSHILGGHARITKLIRTLWFCYPLFPKCLTSCFVDGRELFSAIHREHCKKKRRHRRVVTLLGPNRTWRSVLQAHRQHGRMNRCLECVAAILPISFLGWLVALLFKLALVCVPAWRRFSFATLRPTSYTELLSLYNPFNFQHVKIVGYNNGVVHFGEQFPNRTIVSTVDAARKLTTRGPFARMDAGVTVRQARDMLARQQKDLYVVPNYSYVSLGTAFFVPIHGSAADYCTIADTIQRVLLYDPENDRFVAATRSEPVFDRYIYNLNTTALLLRLTIRVKTLSRYFVKHSTVDNPTGQDVLRIFDDDQPSNIEIRKSRGARQKIDVYRYYSDRVESENGLLEVPRDSIGRLWDRIEENWIASKLFHGVIRRWGYHVELFFTKHEFISFWETHEQLPVSKLQLRFIKRDGLTHSPFCVDDRISADLFMLKRNRDTFRRYLRQHFTAVNANTGKHSM